MGNLLSLYFLHPITTRLANKTHWFNPRYELTNPTKKPPSPFAFSLLSVILLHLHYTLQSPSTLFPIPFTLCYYPPSSCYPVFSSPVTIPCSFVTLSSLTLSLLSSSPVTTPCSFVTLSPHTLSLLSSSPVTIPCSFVTLSPHTLSPLSSSSVTIPRSFVTLSPFYPVSPPCRVKNVYLSYPQGPLLCPRQGLSSMQNMPFLPLEDALLVPWTCPSWRHMFKSLIVRRLR